MIEDDGGFLRRETMGDEFYDDEDEYGDDDFEDDGQPDDYTKDLFDLWHGQYDE